jgi:hypothetical protein
VRGSWFLAEQLLKSINALLPQAFFPSKFIIFKIYFAASTVTNSLIHRVQNNFVLIRIDRTYNLKFCNFGPRLKHGFCAPSLTCCKFIDWVPLLMVICPQDCYLYVRSLGDRDLIPVDKKVVKQFGK